MLRDARELSDGSTIDVDLCIVGGGPAGLTIAREFAGSDLRVALLESGGLEYEPETHALAQGETTGDEYYDLCHTRARRLGGSPHLWNSGLGLPWRPDVPSGFRAGPLAEVDFEAREGIPHSGWPFGRAHLDPYYERAQPLCGLGPFAYRGEDWATADDAKPLPLDPATMTTSVWQFAAKEVFTRDRREEVVRAPNVTTWLHATVVEIETDESGGQATALKVATLAGTRLRVTARRFVLATGGIDNARLLLLSRARHRDGIGNAHDLVGRFFNEHQMLRGGALIPADRRIFNRTALYDVRRFDDVPVFGKIDFTDETLRRERLLNVSFALLPRYRGHTRARQHVVDSFETLVRSAIRLQVPDGAAQHVRNVVTGLDYIAISSLRKLTGKRLFPHFVPAPDIVANEGWSHLSDKDRRFSSFEVILHTEQAPDPENRITLGDRRDAFGNPLPRLHWRWTERDIDSVQRAQALFQREVARAGLGTYVPWSRDGKPLLHHPGLHHHISTTRMDRDPRKGVVDEHSRVHGVGNLFVAGFSVFPTGGYINPTLTVVALALRLADRIRHELGQAAEVRTAAAGA